jgi:hypothetical protein
LNRERGHLNDMKKLLITALTALAIPAAAAAHDGRHHHALLATLSGTSGTLASSSGTLTSAKLGSGTYTATVAPAGAATTRTGDHGTLSCAPATATLTLHGASTTTVTLAGKTCTWTPAGTTTAAGSMFWGRTADRTIKGFLVQKTGSAVKGAVFAGFDQRLFTAFVARQHDAAHHTGDCDR